MSKLLWLEFEGSFIQGLNPYWSILLVTHCNIVVRLKVWRKVYFAILEKKIHLFLIWVSQASASDIKYNLEQAGFSVLKSSALNLELFLSISNALPRDGSDPCPAFSDTQDGRREAFFAFRCMSVNTSPDDTFQTPPCGRWQPSMHQIITIS